MYIYLYNCPYVLFYTAMEMQLFSKVTHYDSFFNIIIQWSKEISMSINWKEMAKIPLDVKVVKMKLLAGEFVAANAFYKVLRKQYDQCYCLFIYKRNPFIPRNNRW